jgi:hypothetical protein
MPLRRTHPVRLLAAPLALVLLGGGLAGCGSSTDDYCGALKDDKARLEKISSSSKSPTTADLRASLGIFEDLQGRAPQDVQGDWRDFVTAWRSLVEAFTDSGVDPGVLAAGKTPTGASAAELREIRDAANGLQAEPVRLAAGRIEDHARTICKVDLGGGLGGS